MKREGTKVKITHSTELEDVNALTVPKTPAANNFSVF